ncbi:cellulose binding domain-containing protein [Dactylosporangium sp. CA-092794]|uniref:cellulose binding domain-containing protein n=1 Tax=Dactylosporangium sp. CA-092794 TaxID=3239929 RepID=UPI003D8DC6DD
MIERTPEGGTGAVWIAYDEVLRRRVAVKLLAARLDDNGRLRFAAQAAALLNHPNVSAVYDYGVSGDDAFIVTELPGGVSLATRLAAGPLPWRAAVEISAYVAAALSAAHTRGLAHGGIAPDTIMLTESGVKVVDFFIASLTGGSAPAGGAAAQAADVRALGAVLFAALTGRPPAAGRAGLLRDAAEPAPLPVIPGMPLEVAALYQRCVGAEPAIRPTSAVLAHRLAALAGVRVGAVDVRAVSPMDDVTANLGGTKELPAAPPGAPAAAYAPDATAVTVARERGRPRRSRSGRLRRLVLGGAVAVAVGVAGAAAADALVRSGDSHPAHWSTGSGAPLGPGSAASASASSPPGSAAPGDPGVSPSAGPSPASTGSCTVSYQVKRAWDDGATVSLSVTNTGRTTVPDWALAFDVDGQVRTGSAWNGTWEQQGSRVTVTGLAGHPDLPAGTSQSDVGVNIDGPHAGTIPDAFTLNGMPCRTTTQP